ncbi:hypothetical protein L6164_037287 [Bauhinia variegata]|uniref:Uncharacterized protein n=1 Tax=Bauhinia variegata TaxID=167791 RepID=A0ACB9KJK0_BAUVA|nr:hypothetical protein L6164_037287 [Bauhinia variegata]
MSIPTVLVLPLPFQGHINPFMDLSIKLADRGFKIIFVNSDFIHQRTMDSLVKSHESLRGSNIKFVSIPDGLGPDEDRKDVIKFFSAVLNTMPGMLEKLIDDISKDGNDRISCIVADAQMGWALEVASKLGIRSAVLLIGSASNFALHCCVPRMIDDGIIDGNGTPVKKGTFQLSPSMPLMNTDHIPWSNFGDLESQKHLFQYYKGFTQILNSTKWWLCNTTYELEPGVLSFIPKLLPIGPFMESSSSKTPLVQLWKEEPSCLDWLDEQPPCSVIYVAFGSLCIFNPNQFKELALGLQLINRPFLWVVRSDINSNTKHEYPDEFHGNLGKIVGWAPQKQVLSHPAIACFISHCGWSSTIEGLCNVGLPLDSNEKGIVSSEEIKKKVEQLINDGNIRGRSMELKEKLMSNIAEGGRSLENFAKFVKWLKE